jgi:beta-glucosidase
VDGDAIAPVLFGDVDPSGKLPVTFPVSLSDDPLQTAAQYPGVTEAGDTVGPHSIYSEGLLVGYRWYDAEEHHALFPFGYGLSYTTFRYSGIAVTRTGTGASVTFTLPNTGSRAGAEVPQVYVGDPASVGEPPKQLEGFRRVELSPGQSTAVTIPLGAMSFAHRDTAGHAWAVSAGTYRVMVGSSSRDIVGQGSVALPAETP